MADPEEFPPVSDHLAWLRAARGYIYAANAIIDHRDFDGEMVAPALYLVAHSLELLLKANIIELTGDIVKAKGFRHRLGELWNAPENERLRQEILKSSRVIYEQAKRTGKIKLNSQFDPDNFIDRKLLHLANLQTEKEIPLRYPVRDMISVPNSRFLIDVLIPVVVEECSRATPAMDDGIGEMGGGAGFPE